MTRYDNKPARNLEKMLKRIRLENEALKKLIEALKANSRSPEKSQKNINH